MTNSAIGWAIAVSFVSAIGGLTACYLWWKQGDQTDPREALGAGLIGLVSGTLWVMVVLTIVKKVGAP